MRTPLTCQEDSASCELSETKPCNQQCETADLQSASGREFQIAELRWEIFRFSQTSATRPQFRSQWKFATRAINTDPMKAAVKMYRAARASELCVTELNMNSPSMRTMQTARDYTPAHAGGATGVLARESPPGYNPPR